MLHGAESLPRRHNRCWNCWGPHGDHHAHVLHHHLRQPVGPGHSDEWLGVSAATLTAAWAGILTLILPTIVIGWGNCRGDRLLREAVQGGVCAIGVLLVCWEKRAGNWRRTYRHHSPGCLPLGRLCDLFYIVVGGYAIVCIGDGGQHSFVSFSRASLATSPGVTFIGVLYQFSSASVPRRFSSSLRIVSARASVIG